MVALLSNTWVMAVLVFAAVALMVVSAVLILEWVRERRGRRDVVAQLRKMELEGPSAAESPSSSVLRSGALAETPWLQPIAARVPHLRDIDHLLRRAELPWSVQTYLLLTGGFALALGLGAAVIQGLGLVSLAAAALGAVLPYLHIRRRTTQRMNAFEEQLPEAVDLVGRAIRAGHPLSAGLKMVAEEAADPIAGEFRQVFEEQRFGLPFEDSLLSLADRIPLVDVRILVTAILIQREVGGNLAEILDKIAHVIRERFMIRRQLRVYTAEARMSMWVLMGLPPGVGLIIFMMNPDYILTLFRTPVGHLLLYASAVMQVMGFLWIRKIVNIEI